MVLLFTEIFRRGLTHSFGRSDAKSNSPSFNLQIIRHCKTSFQVDLTSCDDLCKHKWAQFVTLYKKNTRKQERPKVHESCPRTQLLNRDQQNIHNRQPASTLQISLRNLFKTSKVIWKATTSNTTDFYPFLKSVETIELIYFVHERRWIECDFPESIQSFKSLKKILAEKVGIVEAILVFLNRKKISGKPARITFAGRDVCCCQRSWFGGRSPEGKGVASSQARRDNLSLLVGSQVPLFLHQNASRRHILALGASHKGFSLLLLSWSGLLSYCSKRESHFNPKSFCSCEPYSPLLPPNPTSQP